MKKNNQSVKRYLYRFIKEYKFYFIGLLIIAIIASLFEILVRYNIKQLVDAITNREFNTLTVLIMLFALYKLLFHGMFFITRLLDIKYRPLFVTKLTTSIYKKTIGHSLHWFDSHMSGEIVNKINSFQANVNQLISSVFKTLITLSNISIGILFLFSINLTPALIQIGFLIIYLPLIVFLLKKQFILQKSYEKINQETAGVVNDSIANVFSIKVIGNLANEFKLKLSPSFTKREFWDKKTRRFDAYVVDSIDTIFSVLFTTLQMYFLAKLYYLGTITAGSFMFVAMVVLKLHKDIDFLLDTMLFQINPKVAQIKASYEFANQQYDVVDKKDAKELKNVKGTITFDKVYFSYSESSKDILKDLNLQILPGEKIGLVGYSGAGKTTCVKALIRYFDIHKGSIKIDGHNIQDLTQESLRNYISVIPQDIAMFHRSILENIQIANNSITKQELIKACKKAQIHADIMQMPKGYDTIVGERGVKVSGGQRQRIAIARAIIKNAPILILDEATSSLDSKTEKQIQESLDMFMQDKNKTVIAIAHRLSTLKNMDRIIVLDKGQIIEQGTHKDLISKSESFYKKLWEMQKI